LRLEYKLVDANRVYLGIQKVRVRLYQDCSCCFRYFFVFLCFTSRLRASRAAGWS